MKGLLDILLMVWFVSMLFLSIAASTACVAFGLNDVTVRLITVLFVVSIPSLFIKVPK